MLVPTRVLSNSEAANGSNIRCELFISVRFINLILYAEFTLILDNGRVFWVIDVVIDLVPSDIVVRANICRIVETRLVHVWIQFSPRCWQFPGFATTAENEWRGPGPRWRP